MVCRDLESSSPAYRQAGDDGSDILLYHPDLIEDPVLIKFYFITLWIPPWADGNNKINFFKNVDSLIRRD